MAEIVVVGLKVIHIENNKTNGFFSGPRVFNRFLQQLLKMAVVSKFGERILLRADDDLIVALRVFKRQARVVREHHETS